LALRYAFSTSSNLFALTSKTPPQATPIFLFISHFPVPNNTCFTSSRAVTSRVNLSPSGPISLRLTWRRYGPSGGPKRARGSPSGRTYICTDATVWTRDTAAPAAPAAATAAAASAGAAAAVATAVAAAAAAAAAAAVAVATVIVAVAAAAASAAAVAVAATHRPAGSEARCPVPIWSPGPRWCRSPRSRRARTRTVAARRPGRSPDPAA